MERASIARGPERDRYRFVAPIYDLATAAWSGGAIWRTRHRAVSACRSRDRVLIPGAGTARAAVEAARAGADVVALERSPSMFERARRRIARAGARVDLRPIPLADLDPAERFDVVVAEHFLNVFPPALMRATRDDLLGRLRPGGWFAVADFAPLAGGRLGIARSMQRLHHVLPLGGCALLTGNAMHPIYDHGAELARDDRVELRATFDARSFGIGPRWFRTWVWRRTGATTA
ncbi:MAG: class I SAM-dependent methyltransferase [Planctomycetota bacterium]